QRATALANTHFPLKSEDFLHNISRVAPYQAKSILTQKAINAMEQSLRKDGKPIALNISGLTERSIGDLRAQGYEHIDNPAFRDHVFDRDVAGLIRRYQPLALRLPVVAEQAARINRQLLRFVMYSPHIHGLNIARRMGALSLNHPIEMARYLRHGKALLPAQVDDASRA